MTWEEYPNLNPTYWQPPMFFVLTNLIQHGVLCHAWTRSHVFVFTNWVEAQATLLAPKEVSKLQF